MLKICLVFWKSEPQYAYKRYAYKKNMYCPEGGRNDSNNFFENISHSYVRPWK